MDRSVIAWGAGSGSSCSGQYSHGRGCRSPPQCAIRRRHWGVRGCVLCGPSAARTWGIEVSDRRTWITVSVDRRVRVPGVQVRRERLQAADVVLFEAGWRTTLGRTIFDCLRSLPADAAESLLRQALACGWTTREEFVRRVGLHAGKHGVAQIVALSRLLASQSAPAGPGAQTALSPHHACRGGCFRCHT